jgi:hypothetical protein
VSSADAARGKRDWGDWQSGLYFRDGTPKPAATSFALAMHVDCRGVRKRKYVAWGHLRPGTGARTVTLERVGAKSINLMTDAAGYFTRTLAYTRGARFRFTYRDSAGVRTSVTQIPDRCSGPTPQKRVRALGNDEY